MHVLRKTFKFEKYKIESLYCVIIHLTKSIASLPFSDVLFKVITRGVNNV